MESDQDTQLQAQAFPWLLRACVILDAVKNPELFPLCDCNPHDQLTSIAAQNSIFETWGAEPCLSQKLLF